MNLSPGKIFKIFDTYPSHAVMLTEYNHEPKNSNYIIGLTLFEVTKIMHSKGRQERYMLMIYVKDKY